MLGYNDLARLMGPEQPFYGLQSRGLSGTEKPLTSIEDIAAAFLGEIREVRPEGPYYLVGACMGGIVAYEMAHQLRAAGHEVGLLVLLETWLPVTTSERGSDPMSARSQPCISSSADSASTAIRSRGSAAGSGSTTCSSG